MEGIRDIRISGNYDLDCLMVVVVYLFNLYVSYFDSAVLLLYNLQSMCILLVIIQVVIIIATCPPPSHCIKTSISEFVTYASFGGVWSHI